MPKKLKSQYLEKWEWGLFEGIIIGVMLISFTTHYTNPFIFFLIALQLINIGIDYKIYSGKFKARKTSSRIEESHPKPKASPLTSKALECEECGAKAVVKKGRAWIPRHRKGCSHA